MTDKFDVLIIPIPHCDRHHKPSYKLAIIQFDIVQDGIPFDNGFNGRYECSRKGLEEIVEASEDFLAGKFTKNECLTFEILYIVGNFIRYPYFFDIHVGEKPEDNYWEFKVSEGTLTAEKKGIFYTCILNRNQVAALGQSVARQIKEFDWDICGKTEFFRFTLPDKPYEWCYSAKSLEKALNDVLNGDKIKAIYVTGDDYNDPLNVEDNYWNCYGARLFLEFEKSSVDIMAHAEGLFEIRLFDNSEVEKERFFDVLKESDEVFCDIGFVFHLEKAGETIEQVKVEATNVWMWDAEGFDKSKVSDPIELPASIEFILESRKLLSITGNHEDYSISMDPADE